MSLKDKVFELDDGNQEIMPLVYSKKDVDEAVAELKKRGIKNSESEGNMPYYLLSDKDFKEVFG